MNDALRAHARPKYRIPLVFYDQLGTGQSTNITDALTTFWSAEIFKDELENLLRHLGISGNFDLLGHSWGGSSHFYLTTTRDSKFNEGMLAADFAASRQPAGLRRLILANCPSSMKLAYAGINTYMQVFPSGVLEMLLKHESDATMESPEYKDGKMSFAGKRVCTLDPWPPELLASFAACEANPSVQEAM